jgi:tetratricopeptide (TPR) repeat protein
MLRAFASTGVVAGLVVLLAMSRPLPAEEASFSSPEDAELLPLAKAAKAEFRWRMEPPPPYLAMLAIPERDRVASYVAYTLQSFDAAIDALLIEARSPDRAPQVAIALRERVELGTASAAEALFVEKSKREVEQGMNRTAAASLRHSVALTELQAALSPLIRLPGQAAPLPPLGSKTYPAYLRAAELDPGHAWTWIILALLAPTDESTDAAISNAERAAHTWQDRHASIVSRQTRALFHEKRGRFSDVETAYQGALAIARRWVSAAPSDVLAQRDLSACLIGIGNARIRANRVSDGQAAYQEALNIRLRLAAADPENVQRQIDVIAAHMHMALADIPGEVTRQQWDEAFQLYGTLASRHRFAITSDPFQSGFVIFILAPAGVLTLVIGLVLLARYRRVVSRLMKATASAGVASAVAMSAALASRVDQRVSRRQMARRDDEWRPIQTAARSGRRAAQVYALAGIASVTYGGILYWALFIFDVRWTGIFAQTLSWAWPVVLTLALLWGPDRRRLCWTLACYFGVLLAFCTKIHFSSTPPLEIYGVTLQPFFQPLYVWFLSAYPTVYLLLFLDRGVRAIGPTLLLLMIILVAGAQAGLTILSVWSVLQAVSRLAAIIPLQLLTTGFEPFLAISGMLLCAPVAWYATRWLAQRYRRKAFGEQTLVLDSIWLFQTAQITFSTVRHDGLWGWLGIGCFAVYKLITWIGLRRLAREAAGRTPARLLLLRTFGLRRRAEKFFDLLGARWRYIGPIQLIAAPDIAGRSVDPGKFLDFLGGRLRRRFVIETGDLELRFRELDDKPDPDGRYRVNELFCGHDAWRPAVRVLMAESDIVAMDLRGFSASNQGCLYELQCLIDIVPIERIILLTDRTTDRDHLGEALAASVSNMATDSPNCSKKTMPKIIETGHGNVRALKSLLTVVDRLFSSSPSRAPGAVYAATSPS